MTSQTDLQARLDELVKERAEARQAAGGSRAVIAEGTRMLDGHDDLVVRWAASMDQLSSTLEMSLDARATEVLTAGKRLAKDETSDAEKRETVRGLLSRIEHLESDLRRNTDELEMQRKREAAVYTVDRQFTKAIYKVRAEIRGVEYRDPDEDQNSREAHSGRPGSSHSRTRARRVESEPALPNLSLEE